MLLPAALCESLVRHLHRACLPSLRFCRDYGLLCKSVHFFFACGALRDDLPHRLRRAKGRDFRRPRRLRAFLISCTARRAALCTLSSSRARHLVPRSCMSALKDSICIAAGRRRVPLARRRPCVLGLPARVPCSLCNVCLCVGAVAVTVAISGRSAQQQCAGRARSVPTQLRARRVPVAYLQTGARPCQ